MVRRHDMVQLNRKDGVLVGKAGGSRSPRRCDDVTRKLVMLIEGECEGLGPLPGGREVRHIPRKGSFQLRQIYLTDARRALASGERGPKTNYRRTSEIVRQIIRYRFLDPKALARFVRRPEAAAVGTGHQHAERRTGDCRLRPAKKNFTSYSRGTAQENAERFIQSRSTRKRTRRGSALPIRSASSAA